MLRQKITVTFSYFLICTFTLCWFLQTHNFNFCSQVKLSLKNTTQHFWKWSRTSWTETRTPRPTKIALGKCLASMLTNLLLWIRYNIFF